MYPPAPVFPKRSKWNRRFRLFIGHNLHTPRYRNSVFTMAVTPQQDMLAFVAKPDGKYAAFGPVLLDLLSHPMGVLSSWDAVVIGRRH